MAITNKLITFNKLTSFETQLAQGNILETSIVFIKDAKKIWTKGTYFDCSGGGSNNIAIYETTDDVYNGVLNNAFELRQLLSNNSIYTLVIIQKSSVTDERTFVFNSSDKRLPMNSSITYTCVYSEADYRGNTTNLIFYQIARTGGSEIILNKHPLALKSDIGYTTEFSVADIEAVYGRGITKPINVQGLMSAIEANKPIIIPTNITDASQVGGNAVTMAKMENDGFIYLNVIVPYLDGVHKEYFIQIKITTAQLIKSGSNGSITLKELVAKTDLKTINGESILGSGDIDVQGGEDNRYFTEFTVGDFINACKNEGSLVSNGLCEAIMNNKIICVPYSLESYDSGYIIASCKYGYSEVSTEPYSFGCIIEKNQTTYLVISESSVANNDTFLGFLPTSACPQVVYLDSFIYEYEDNITYMISPSVQVNELVIVPKYFSKGTTIRFITGDNPSIEFMSNVLWANGVIPEIETNTWYELSLTSTDDENILAVLTPFKSV